MKIAVINDLSGMGRCSLVASISVLSVLGQQVFPVPTAILSNQTGYPQFSFVDFTDNMDEYLANWQDMGTKFDVIYSGFLSNCSQVQKIEKMRKTMGHENTLLVVDPVMGDGGQKYATFSDELCNEVKILATMADVVTPNVTEACLLTGIDYNDFVKNTNVNNFQQRFCDLAKKVSDLGPQKVVITGWESNEQTKQVYNFVFDNGDFTYTKNDMYGGHYSGTGDVMASIITGKLAQGKKLFDATKTAADFVAVAVKDAFENNVPQNDGVNFEKFLHLLI
ncbi:MAG: pyridoxamine kinase [Clostridia bacterium]|nr:pyridoxamine kinase [Clostridia bacterium]